MQCKICKSPASLLGTYEIIGKYSVRWFRCQTCGFTQTEEPFWLKEAYSCPINKTDVGVISRNVTNAHIANAVIVFFFNPAARFLDYGGGYGIFCRMMRDKGFDFYRYDKYCQNIFAAGFDKDDLSDIRFELVTAFEVFEHFSDPLVDIDGLFELSSNIFFSTVLLPEANPKPGEWWYYGLEHGQHIALYTEESLRYFAKSKGLNLYSNGKNYHLFSKKKLSPFAFKMACNFRLAMLTGIFFNRQSLITSDYELVVGRKPF